MKTAPMPTSMDAEQERHDAAHPGKVCRSCPRTKWDEYQSHLRSLDFARREQIRSRVQVAFVLLVLLGCWFLTGLIH